MIQYAQRHRYLLLSLAQEVLRPLQISDSLDLPYRKNREYQGEASRWIWLGYPPCREDWSLPEEKATTRKVHHEQTLLNMITITHSTSPKHKGTLSLSQKKCDPDVVKATWWLLLMDSSSQYKSDTLIKSGMNLGRINENTNSGIFSTVLKCIFSQSWHISPVTSPLSSPCSPKGH